MKRTRKSPKNQKGKSMKKNTMETLVRYLNGETVDNLDEIKAELEAELAKNAEKAQANRELYDATHDVFVNALTDTPQTLAEIWERIKDEVPGGMTKSKIQYAVREYWSADVAKIEGKVNEYKRA